MAGRTNEPPHPRNCTFRAGSRWSAPLAALGTLFPGCFLFCLFGSGLGFFLRLRFFSGRFFSGLRRSFFCRRFPRRNGLRGRRNAWALGNDQLLFAFFLDDLFRITAEFFLFFEMDELVVVTGCFFFVGHPTSPFSLSPCLQSLWLLRPLAGLLTLSHTFVKRRYNRPG